MSPKGSVLFFSLYCVIRAQQLSCPPAHFIYFSDLFLAGCFHILSPFKNALLWWRWICIISFLKTKGGSCHASLLSLPISKQNKPWIQKLMRLTGFKAELNVIDTCLKFSWYVLFGKKCDSCGSMECIHCCICETASFPRVHLLGLL